MQEVYTLITGSGAGIGKALAVECAKRKMNLILVALPGEELKNTSAEIRSEFDVRVEELGIDLTAPNAPSEVKSFCDDKGLNVNILINNAGIGSTGAFEDFPVEFYQKQTMINVVCTTLLTRLFIPELKKHNPAFLLNVGSMGGFYDMPYKAVYSASKKYIYSLSKALRRELKNTTVTISVLCPAAVDTNERVTAHNSTLKGAAKAALMMPDQVAKEAVQKMLKKKAVIIPGAYNRFTRSVGRLVPDGLKMRMVARFFKPKK